MTTDIKELVTYLRALRINICDAAADALEALAGEVEQVNRAAQESCAQMNDALGEATAERERLKAALREQHNWHLNAGAIGLPDGNGGWVEIDNAAEYSDGPLCSRTIEALGDAS